MAKVLFLTHVGDPGGAEFKMMDLCCDLGDKAEVLHFQPGSLSHQLKEKNIQHSVLELPAALVGFKREQALLKAFPPFFQTLGFLRRLFKATAEYPIYVCMSQKAFVLMSLLKPFHRKPIIWFMNDLLSAEHFSRSLIFLLTRLARFSASHLVVNSQASYDAWVNASGNYHNVEIIYPGTDFNQIAQRISKQQEIAQLRKELTMNQQYIVGLFGRLTPWKGQDIFLQAISKLPDTHALIVGDAFFGQEDYQKQLEELVEKLNLQSRVTFTGHSNQVAEWMAACDIVVHCSTAPEPFGLVIVEGMAALKPVIASDGGGAQEIVLDQTTGQLTPMKDVDALVEAIARYIDDPVWAQQLAINGYTRSKQLFSTQTMVEKFRAILSKQGIFAQASL
jgi:glycosyltransferase involved in cell wall biosynthesis